MSLLSPLSGSSADGEVSAAARIIISIFFVVACGGCAQPTNAVFRRTAETHIGLEPVFGHRADSLLVGIVQALPAGGDDETVVISTAPSEKFTLWLYSRDKGEPIARRGGGPGELAVLGSLATSDSGLLAFDVGRQSLLAFDGRGRFVGEQRVRHVVPLSAILDRQGNLYWVEAKDGSATFLRMDASGAVQSVRSDWPWRRTLRAARLAVVGGDSIAAFSDLTGCIGVVTFAIRASSVLGCIDDTLQSDVALAASRSFKRAAANQNGALIPNFPLEAMIRIGPHQLLLAVPALDGRRAASYVVDLDSLTLSDVRYDGVEARLREFRPQSGGWRGSDTYLSDGFVVLKAVVACSTGGSRGCARPDALRIQQSPP